MKLKDALKPTGAVTKHGNLADYAELVEDIDAGGRHYMLWEGEEGNYVHYDDIMDTDWEPYYPKSAILPTEAGEVWSHNGLRYLHCQNDYSGEHSLIDIWKDTYEGEEPMHGHNGWERLIPAVEEEKDLPSLANECNCEQDHHSVAPCLVHETEARKLFDALYGEFSETITVYNYDQLKEAINKIGFPLSVSTEIENVPNRS